jgi:hypothetical protein
MMAIRIGVETSAAEPGPVGDGLPPTYHTAGALAIDASGGARQVGRLG